MDLFNSIDSIQFDFMPGKENIRVIHTELLSYWISIWICLIQLLVYSLISCQARKT